MQLSTMPIQSARLKQLFITILQKNVTQKQFCYVIRKLILSCLILIPTVQHSCPDLCVVLYSMLFSNLKDNANKFGNTQGFKHMYSMYYTYTNQCTLEDKNSETFVRDFIVILFQITELEKQSIDISIFYRNRVLIYQYKLFKTNFFVPV